MLRVALNTQCRVHVTNKDLYNIIPKMTVSIQEQRLRFVGHYWMSKNELVSDCLLWQPLHGQRPRGRPAKTFFKHLLFDIYRICIHILI